MTYLDQPCKPDDRVGRTDDHVWLAFIVEHYTQPERARLYLVSNDAWTHLGDTEGWLSERRRSQSE